MEVLFLLIQEKKTSSLQMYTNKNFKNIYLQLSLLFIFAIWIPVTIGVLLRKGTSLQGLRQNSLDLRDI